MRVAHRDPAVSAVGVTTPNVKNSTFRPVWLRPEYKQAAGSPVTKRAYGSDFRFFAAWCGQAGDTLRGHLNKRNRMYVCRESM